MKKHLYLMSFVFMPIVIGAGFFLVFGTSQQDREVDSDQDSHKSLRIETLQDLDLNDGFYESDASFKQDDEIYSKRKIQITDGVKHTVPLEDILGGGPPKDGIPPINNPIFISINESEDFLGDNEPGLSFKYGDDVRFYPFKILVWHEIINDTYDDKKVLISYCPLCLSGIVFEPYVDGEYVEFGTSGKLWNSNLVMYDRKTDSYWSQLLGESIAGEQAGKKLNVLPFDQLRFGEWKKKYPNGRVLSKKTGAIRFYATDPYGDYYTEPGTYFPVDKKDSRLDEKQFVLGVVIDGQAKAYSPQVVKEQVSSKGVLRDAVGDTILELQYDFDLDVVRVYKVINDNTLERINPIPGFWFSWVAVHPETLIFE